MRKGTTLVSAGDFKSKGKAKKTESAKNIGLELAKTAKLKKIESVAFDGEDTNIKAGSGRWRKERERAG